MTLPPIRSLLTTKKDFTKMQGSLLFDVIGDSMQFYCQGIRQSDGSNRVLYYELLVRFLHNNKLYLPGDVLPHLNKEMCHYIAARGLETISTLQKQYPGASFALNVSPEAFDDAYAKNRMMGDIRHMLDNGAIEAERLFIELTEHGVMACLNEEAHANLKHLKSKGVRIALDDFGAKSSNFNHLFEGSEIFDLIKVDGALVKGLMADSNKLDVLKVLITTIRTMGFDVALEYIEDAAAYDSVKSLGAHYLQGFYFGTPEKMLSPIRTSA